MLRAATFVIIFHFLSLQVIAPSPWQLDHFNGKSIAIIGGGPVGLYTARRISDEYRDTVIQIFEKRVAYTRDQVVSLSGWHIPIKNSPQMKGRHPIKQIENLLKNELMSRGNILIHTWEFTDIDSLVKQFYKTRKPDVIIFANGAKTTMREKYFSGSDAAIQFANAMSVHYSRAPGLNSIGLSYSDTYRISKLIGAQLFQALRDHVNVRLIMIGPFTQKEFHQKMNAVINARRVELGERLGSQPTTRFFSLRVEIAKEVQSRYGNIHLYLIGDAAAILPYQLGLNTGFSSVEILVMSPRNYGDLARDLFMKKKSLANWKYLISEYFRVFMKTSSSVPWEFVRWNEKYNRLLLTTPDITSNYVLQHQYTQQRKLPIQRTAERIKMKIKIGT